MTEDPFLIDTHVWLWWENATPGLISSQAARRIEAAERESGLWIASISVWEVAMLEIRQRIEVVPDSLTWVRKALSRPDRTLVPLTPEIAVASTRLPDPPTRDPVDRILLATARVENLTLVTADRKLLDYAKRRHVKALPI